jgi:hypothetical protein
MFVFTFHRPLMFTITDFHFRFCLRERGDEKSPQNLFIIHHYFIMLAASRSRPPFRLILIDPPEVIKTKNQLQTLKKCIFPSPHRVNV